MQCVCCRGPLHTGVKYCSITCQRDYEWERRKEVFEATGLWGNDLHEVSIRRHTKRYLLETQGHRCSVCTTEEWRGQPVPLIIDHVNGNSSDNALSNFRLVCGNCDMQLPTYKSRNNGNGRAERRQRYADGKTY